VLRSAAGITLAGASGSGQTHQHAVASHSVTAGAHWNPKFLTTQQNDALLALGERIIPGSTKACCNQTIDLLMTIESKAHQSELTDALAAFDAEAHTHHREKFSELLAEQQDAVLTSASIAGSPLNAKFQVVKEWLVDTYWSSQQGMHELGWNGQVAWTSFPACPHPGEAERATS
jgi:hypothetical protein